MCFVVERDVPKNPLWVCELEYPGDKLLGLIFAVEIAAWHGKVKGLYGVEVRWDMALREVPPSDEILTSCELLELRGHESHCREGPVTPHEYIFWSPIENLWVSLIISWHPWRQIVDVLAQQFCVAIVREEHKMGIGLSSSTIWASLVWKKVAWVLSPLNPGATEAGMLFWPPYHIHIRLILEGEVQVFPVHCVEAVVRPFISGTGSQIPSCHLLTCVKT